MMKQVWSIDPEERIKQIGGGQSIKQEIAMWKKRGRSLSECKREGR
jgi:hypothetical protein